MLNKSSLIKPSLTTKFRVDFDWWKMQDRNWRNSLVSFMCPKHQELFAHAGDAQEMDLVDPETGEISRGDGLIQTLVEHCARQEYFITSNTPLVDSVFKVFLVNHNQPLDSVELADRIGKPAETILRTIGTTRVYKGIRPV
ncbi:MAG: hypothetical protein KBA05_02895 [Anaerolineaceae bacterium]|jgi:hypothetical protein|nr:hypothetical protein [Anaerolineaceae bacterium]MDI9530417.1 hypothetical protein [Chloroflexota bacterium]